MKSLSAIAWCLYSVVLMIFSASVMLYDFIPLYEAVKSVTWFLVAIIIFINYIGISQARPAAAFFLFVFAVSFFIYDVFYYAIGVNDVYGDLEGIEVFYGAILYAGYILFHVPAFFYLYKTFRIRGESVDK